jgi:hypothetical protein
MSTTELKSQLNRLLERIDDERLLRAIYSFLRERENAQDGQLWESLTPEQKEEVLLALDEADDDSNLISDADVWKDIP